MLGHRQLDQDAVDLGVLVVFVDQGQQGGLSDVRGLIVLDGVEPQLMGGLLLGGDVADGGRVFAHQDGDQAGGKLCLALSSLYFLLQFLANLGGDLRPFDQFGSHVTWPPSLVIFFINIINFSR